MNNHRFSEELNIAAQQHIEERDYWFRILKDVSGPTLFPADFTQSDSQFKTEAFTFVLPEVVSRQLLKMSKGSDHTLHVILCAACGVLLSRYADQADVLLGTTIYRKEDEKDRQYINSCVPLRLSISDDMAVRRLLMQTREVVTGAIKNYCYPIEILTRDVMGASAASDPSARLFDVAVLNANIQTIDDLKSVRPNIVFIFFRHDQKIECRIDYNVLLYLSKTVELMAGRLGTLMGKLFADASQPLSESGILSAEEKQRLLVDFNDTAQDFDLKISIHQLFQEMALKHETSDAVVDKSGASITTYSQLQQRSDRLARTLTGFGVGDGSIVALMSEPSVELLIGILAILKAGAAYMPVDPVFPHSRRDYMLRDSRTRILLTQAHLLDDAVVREGQCRVINLNDDATYSDKCEPLELTGSADHLLYVIYTSGTTGKPKGVQLSHRNLVNYVNWFSRAAEVTPADRTLLVSSFAFDLGYTVVYPALLNGAALHLLSKDQYMAPDVLLGYIGEHGITYLKMTPSMFNVIVSSNRFKNETCESLRLIVLGGEAIIAGDVAQAHRTCPNIRFMNHYGPTEATIGCIAQFIDFEDFEYYFERPTIGKPIANTRVYIVGRDMKPRPIGLPGELCVAGKGLARGYLNKPEVTAEKFIASKISPGETLYRTGDLVRYTEDGLVEFLGRVDHQVKIRGYRIELGEIESRLNQLSGVNDCVVVVKGDGPQDKSIVAYIVPSDGNLSKSEKQEEIKGNLSLSLPDYMIPSFFIFLDKLPLTANGKVDRKALPEPEPEFHGEYIAPEGPVEKVIAGIWGDLLSIDPQSISSEADFFQVGGNSLRATVLVGRMHREFEVSIPLNEVFRAPTIQGLASFVQLAGKDDYSGIVPVEKRDYYTLSSAQKRLYVLQRMDRKSTVYNMPRVVRLRDDTDWSLVDTVFRQLSQRHESFRTSFVTVNDEPVQRVHDDVVVSVERFGDVDSPHPLIRRLIRPFDPAIAPLVRAAVLRLTSGECIMFVDMHHIISDGVSIGVLIDEFRSLLAGEALLPNLIQYKDYAAWYENYETKEKIQQQETYWLAQCAGEIPVLTLPYDFPRPAVQSFAGGTIGFGISAEHTQGLRQLAAKRDVTLFMLLFSIFNVLLARLSNQEDIMVGTPVAGRRHADLESVIGMFVNTLVIRTFPEQNLEFRTYLHQVKEKAIAAFDNQDYQFEELVDRLDVKRDAARNPLFDVMFVMQNAREYGPAQENRNQDRVGGVSRFDITWSALERGDELAFGIEYCSKLFNTNTIERFIQYFQRTIGVVLENDAVCLGEISIIDDRERLMLLEEFNSTQTDYPREATIFELFAEQAVRIPDQTAILSSDLVLTYGEVERQSGIVASQLQVLGCGDQEVVGVMMNRNATMAVTVLGILRIGGIYMPINADYPPERIAFLLNDSRCGVVMTDSDAIGSGISAKQIKTVALSPDGPVPVVGNGVHHSLSGLSSSLAYIIYTSGSTGKPKGVMVEQKNVVRLVKNTNYCTFIQGSRILQTGALEFDASTLEIWGSLLNGLTLCLAPKEEILSPARLKAVIRRWDIDIMWMTVALFNQMVTEDIEVFRGLRQFFVGGDALSPFHINLLRKQYPSLSVTNGYGPTENTTFSTTYLIKRDYNHNIPIGAPIANSTAYILDQRGNPQPLGVPGELCVGGDGVARGYMNQPQLTAEKFVANPFMPKTKLYRTGDLARYLPDGAIEFLGRFDFQVKIRGFRVELGEIENRLLCIDGIDDAVVLARQTENSEKYLCGYVVASAECDGDFLKQELGGSLPDYMVPSVFMFLDAIPLTPNGKVDRRALPEPEFEMSDQYVAPACDVEKALVTVWSSVLGIDADDISVTSDFFDLGGHSLRATILVGRIHRQLNVEIPLAEIFRIPTIRELAAFVKHSKQERYTSIPIAEKKDYYPTTSAQRRLFILQRMDPNSVVYNIPGVLRLRGKIDLQRIEALFEAVIARHESFRTSFATVGDEPVQRVADTVDFNIEALEGIDEATLLHRHTKPFDLARAPLLRVALAALPDEDHLLLVDMHHIISDGTSMDVLAREFNELRAQRELPDLRIQYKDFAEWRAKLEILAKTKEQQSFWLETLKGDLPVLSLPYDFPRPAVQSFEGSLYSFEIGASHISRLREIGQQHGATLFMVLLALFNVLLSRLSGQEDIVVGTPVAGRRHADLEPIIGMFVNTLVLRNFPEHEIEFSAFLKTLKEGTLGAYENQDTPFEDLVEQVVIDRDAGRNPLFDAMFVLQNIGGNDGGAMDGEEAAGLDEDGVRDHGSRVSRFDMTWTAVERRGGLFIWVEYCSRLFEKETIRRFIGYFKRIVEAVAAKPNVLLRNIEIMAEAERHQLLVTFNATEAVFNREATIHDFLDRHLDERSDSIAVVYEDCQLTYRGLMDRAGRLGGYLREKGAGAGNIVAILSEPSLEMMVGIVGILRSGAAFLPIDHTYPDSRVSYMIRDSGAKAVLCRGKFIGRMPEQAAVVSLDGPVFRDGSIPIPEPGNNAMDPAYIIYTSGSTGNPKGVVIQHRSLLNLATWHNNYYSITSWDRASKYAGFSFDATIFEVFPNLVSGGAVAVVPQSVKLDLFQLNRFFDRYLISVAFLPTQVCEQYTRSYDNAHLRVVLTGGDKLREYIPRSFRLVNDYGPTENTVVSTSFFLDHTLENIPIGKPVPNTTVYIVGPGNELRPIGVAGELCVGGVQLARGYLNRPELTDEKFVDNPFVAGEKVYRTGDLARWLPSGDIEFLGRIDFQVKIRGLRIELGEIESQLMRMSEIQNAVVLARDNSASEKYLCAYVVAAEGFDKSAASKILAEQLPDYMVPSYFVELDTIPLTPNGKVDRKALPEPEIDLGDVYVPPTDVLEETLVSIWSDLLRIDSNSISVSANFFQLGGHSLRATILVGRIRRELQVDVPLTEIFRVPTIQGLAAFIRDSKKELFSSIEVVEKRDYYPLSPAQERLYILQQMDTASSVYNVPTMQELRGKIDPRWIERAFGRLIQRHESFRTSYETVGEHPVQRIHDRVDFRLDYIDESHTADSIPPVGYRRRFIRAFNLSKAPLLRVQLVKLKDDHHLLLMDMHHIISDGASMEILVREFFALLDQRELPELKLQYKDFALWQRSSDVVATINKQRTFWLDTFSGEVPALSLPFDYPRPEFQSFEGASVNFQIGSNRTRALGRLAQGRGATMFMALQAVFALILAKLSGQEDIVLGTPVAGRRHAELEGIIGMFVNTLGLRQFLASDKLFIEFLDQVKERTLDAFENQDLPFEDLVETLSLTRDAGRNPLFDVMLVLQNTGDAVIGNVDVEDDDSLDIKDGSGSVSRFDMTWTMAETSRGLRVSVEYCTRLFNRDTICRFIGYFSSAIDAVLASPNMRLGDISLLSKEEKRLLLEEFNDTATNYPNQASVHELFARQVRQTPNWVALISDDLFLSYQELHHQSDLLAAELQRKGCGHEDVVAVMMGRTSSVAVALLGILKSGGGYMPISSDYPPERITYILDDSSARFMITDNIVNFQDANQPQWEILRLQADRPVNMTGKQLDQDVAVHSRSLAYILYTSGSTGMPKGVMVEHRSVVRLVKETDYIEFLPGDRFLQTAALEFDVSTYEFWGALLNGLTLCVAPLDQILSPRHIKGLIRRLDIGTMWMTVALFNQMSQDDIDIFEGLRRVISGGDALSPHHINRLRGHYPHLTIINGYGPTENTCYSTTHTIRQDYPDSIPIGRPIANSTAYVVDRDLQLCPLGVAGELCVGGDGVARGYLNRPELTAERFVDNPHKAGDRLYHTGDLSRYRADGILEFFGRLDFQVKIRGFRVELGEIENQLLAIDGIDEAVVLAKETEQRERYLCAYVGATASLDSHALKEELGKNLPDFMVPAYVVLLDKLPINHNGKVDRRALPEPELEAADEIEAPATETERRLTVLWSEVLDIDEDLIGTTASFFDIGGHSLKGMQLSTKVRQEFGSTLPLVTIFRRQTVRAQAQFLDNQRPVGITVDDERLVVLNEASAEAGNLFFVHDGTGEVDGYIECVNHLGLDLNCWGIRAEGLKGLAPDNRSIEVMAREYIEKMMELQPHGPYALVGWSLGGTIVFEIVRQLEAIGQAVSMALLVDSPPPQMFKQISSEEFSPSGETGFIAHHIETANISLQPEQPESILELWRQIAEYLREVGVEPEVVARIARNYGMQGLSRLNDLDIEGILYYLNLGRTLIRTRAAYEPDGPVETPIFYIAARESKDVITEDWNPYCAKLSIEEVDGDHHSIFRSSHVEALAAVIRRLVDEARAL